MTITLQQVQPGDLITAQFMNDLINQLKSLDQRLASVEQSGAQGSAGSVTITALDPPSGSLRVGDFLHVYGTNFGFSVGSHRVYIDDLRVNAFESASSDQHLHFRIPLTILDAPAAGRPAVLTVSNASSTAQRTLLLRSAMDLAGAVNVNYNSVQPTTPTANAQATFEFQVMSQANLEATYTLTALVNVAANASQWNSALRILDANQAEIPNRQITLTPGQAKTIFVRLTQIPNVPNGTAFSVSLSAASGPVTGSSGNMPFVVGSGVQQPDSTITINAPTIDVITGTANVTATSLTASNGAIVNMQFPATFSIAASYDIVPSLQSGATNWAVVLLATTPNPLPVQGTELNNPEGKAKKNIGIAIQRNAGATAGVLELKVTRQGQTQNRTRTIQLVLG